MSSLPDDIKEIVITLAQVLRSKGEGLLFNIMQNASTDIWETSNDNGYGGTYGYTLNLHVPIDLYGKIQDNLQNVEKDILDKLRPLTRIYDNQYLNNVIIGPKLITSPIDDGKNRLGSIGGLNGERFVFWKEGYFRLFLSHVSHQKGVASELKKKLDDYAISAFVAHEDIEPTKEWQVEIEHALSSMDGLSAILTKGFAESMWCDQEVGVAIGRKVLVIPIIAGINPYGFIGKYQGLSSSNKDASTICDEIFNILLNNPTTKRRITDAIVYKLCNSGAFKESINTVKFLEKATDNLTSEMKDKLKEAIKYNYQISGTSNVVEKINRIIN